MVGGDPGGATGCLAVICPLNEKRLRCGAVVHDHGKQRRVGVNRLEAAIGGRRGKFELTAVGISTWRLTKSRSIIQRSKRAARNREVSYIKEINSALGQVYRYNM